MSSTTPLAEANLSQTKEFVLMTDMPPLSFYVPHPRHDRTQIGARLNATTEESSLCAFHEEFKRLVLASHESALVDFVAVADDEFRDSSELESINRSERVALKRFSPSRHFAA